jgi:hypothetical protein
MTEIEFGVHVVDTAPGSVAKVENAGSLARAKHRLAYYRNIDKTRRTYGVSAQIMQRTDGSEWTPWEGE